MCSDGSANAAGGYQTRINAVLRAFIAAQSKRALERSSVRLGQTDSAFTTLKLQ